MIGKTVTLKKEKNAQRSETMTHPVKNFFENLYAVPYKLSTASVLISSVDS